MVKNVNIGKLNVRKMQLVREKLIGKSCFNCQNSTCRVQPMEYELDVNCIGWENSDIIKAAYFQNVFDINKLKMKKM